MHTSRNFIVVLSDTKLTQLFLFRRNLALFWFFANVLCRKTHLVLLTATMFTRQNNAASHALSVSVLKKYQLVLFALVLKSIVIFFCYCHQSLSQAHPYSVRKLLNSWINNGRLCNVSSEMTNQTRPKYAHYTSYGRLMVIYKKHRFICHPNFTASCRLHIVSTSEFTAIATARSQVEVSECFSHQTIDCIVTKHAARIISSFYDVITLFKSLRFKNFDIQRFSSSSFVYCSYFKLAMSNVVFVSKQFRTTNILSRSLPVFLSEKQSKSKLFNHLFLFYFLSISTFWKPIPSKGLKFLENKEVHHLH